MKRFALALAAAASFLAAAPPARATSLTANSTVTPSSMTLSGGTLIDSRSATLTATDNAFTATVVSGVYREAGGTLSFLYQIINDGSSSDAIHRVTNSAFTGFTTDVGYSSSAVGGPFSVAITAANPMHADRSGGLTGERVVGFAVDNAAGSSTDWIKQGQTSPILVIRTDATNYIDGVTSVIDGGVASFTTFAPAAVPEPASAVLLGGCLLGLGAGMWRGGRKNLPGA